VTGVGDSGEKNEGLVMAIGVHELDQIFKALLRLCALLQPLRSKLSAKRINAPESKSSEENFANGESSILA
jgi:hypothetical protein